MTSANARDRILAAARAGQPAPLPLPPVAGFGGDASTEKFTSLVHSIGGQVVELASLSALPAALAGLFPAAGRVASPLLPGTVAVDAATPLAELAGIDLAVLRGEFGVAENGSVWLPEANILHRALPTVTQHLALVLDRRQLVATMHQAYARLSGRVGGYGVFLAGPSKTADIEQSLVIGAHGARSLTVLLH